MESWRAEYELQKLKLNTDIERLSEEKQYQAVTNDWFS